MVINTYICIYIHIYIYACIYIYICICILPQNAHHCIDQLRFQVQGLGSGAWGVMFLYGLYAWFEDWALGFGVLRLRILSLCMVMCG